MNNANNPQERGKPQETEKSPEIDKSQEVYASQIVENSNENNNFRESERVEIISEHNGENENNIKMTDIKNEKELNINTDTLSSIMGACTLNEPEEKKPTKKLTGNNIWLKKGIGPFLFLEGFAAICFFYPILNLISWIIAGISAVAGVVYLVGGIIKSIIQCKEDNEYNKDLYQNDMNQYIEKQEMQKKINENTSLSNHLKGFKLLLDIEQKDQQERKNSSFITLKNKYFIFSIDNAGFGNPLIYIKDLGQKNASGRNQFQDMELIFQEHQVDSTIAVNDKNQNYAELLKFLTDQLKRNHTLIKDPSLQGIIIGNKKYDYKNLETYRYLAEITKSTIDGNLKIEEYNDESNDRLKKGLSDAEKLIQQFEPDYKFNDEENVEEERSKDDNNRINEIQEEPKPEQEEEEENKEPEQEEDKKSAHEEEEKKKLNNIRVNGFDLVGINESDIVRDKK